MAYLIQISDEGILKEIALQKKITTIAPQKDADFTLSSHKDRSIYFQLIENNGSFEMVGLTSTSYFLHQGERKRNLKLSTYDFFEIGNSRFVFSKKPFQTQTENHKDALSHYQRFYQFSAALSKAETSKDIFRKLLDLILELSKANKGFLLSSLPTPDSKFKLELVAVKGVPQKSVEDSLEEVSQTVIKQVRQSLSALIIDNIHDHLSFKGTESIYRMQLSSVACFPLLIQKKCLGFLYLGSDRAEGFFDPMTVQMIETLLAQAALILEHALLIERLEEEKKALKERLEGGAMIGASSVMENLFEKIEKIAPLDLAVLIVGETGTGKEMVAREIHRKSARAGMPFVTINCGAIPENLLESILFGHKKGAFTGAVSDQIGKFEAAHGGTIFLDEIAEMPLGLQVKLLRVLQEKKIERIGEIKEIAVDIRIVAATHQDIEKLIQNRKFREDLYYRLNEIYLNVPPLRSREGDILLLAQHFIEKYRNMVGETPKKLTKEAQEKLLQYHWPGNIRELENLMKRTLVFCEVDTILPEHIEIRASAPSLPSFREARGHFQKDYLHKILTLYRGDKEKAAQALGISVRTLFRMMKSRNTDKTVSFDTENVSE